VHSDDSPDPDAIAIDPELAILHALRVQLRMASLMLEALLLDLPDQAVLRAPIESETVARILLTRAADLQR